MRHIAYLYKRGPWKHCYVKFGYDPRIDPKAAMYQTFEIGTGESNGAKRYANPKSLLFLYIKYVIWPNSKSSSPKLSKQILIMWYQW